jgi:hypothetical protein
MGTKSLVIFAIAVAGCGDSGIMNSPDMAMHADQAVPLDMAVPADMAKPLPDLATIPHDFGGVACGMSTCGPKEVCCITQDADGGASAVCSMSCADGGIAVMCDGPEDCDPNANKYCCADVMIGAGQAPNCPIDGAKSACAAQCKTNIQLMCPATNKVRLCHAPADCADDPSNKNCCKVVDPNSGNSFTGCVSDIIKGFIVQAGGMCF